MSSSSISTTSLDSPSFDSLSFDSLDLDNLDMDSLDINEPLHSRPPSVEPIDSNPHPLPHCCRAGSRGLPPRSYMPDPSPPAPPTTPVGISLTDTMLFRPPTPIQVPLPAAPSPPSPPPTTTIGHQHSGSTGHQVSPYTSSLCPAPPPGTPVGFTPIPTAPWRQVVMPDFVPRPTSPSPPMMAAAFESRLPGSPFPQPPAHTIFPPAPATQTFYGYPAGQPSTEPSRATTPSSPPLDLFITVPRHYSLRTPEPSSLFAPPPRPRRRQPVARRTTNPDFGFIVTTLPRPVNDDDGDHGPVDDDDDDNDVVLWEMDGDDDADQAQPWWTIVPVTFGLFTAASYLPPEQYMGPVPAWARTTHPFIPPIPPPPSPDTIRRRRLQRSVVPPAVQTPAFQTPPMPLAIPFSMLRFKTPSLSSSWTTVSDTNSGLTTPSPTTSLPLHVRLPTPPLPFGVPLSGPASIMTPSSVFSEAHGIPLPSSRSGSSLYSDFTGWLSSSGASPYSPFTFTPLGGSPDWSVSSAGVGSSAHTGPSVSLGPSAGPSQASQPSWTSYALQAGPSGHAGPSQHHGQWGHAGPSQHTGRWGHAGPSLRGIPSHAGPSTGGPSSQAPPSFYTGPSSVAGPSMAGYVSMAPVAPWPVPTRAPQTVPHPTARHATNVNPGFTPSVNDIMPQTMADAHLDALDALVFGAEAWRWPRLSPAEAALFTHHILRVAQLVHENINIDQAPRRAP